MGYIDFDKEQLLRLLKRLISIESINPAYNRQKEGEGDIGHYVFEYLKGHGIECMLQEVLPYRYNVIAKIKGCDDRGICFETHLDTVGSVDPEAINPVIRNGYVYGLGSCDAKASLAAMIYTLKTLKDNRMVPSTDIYLAAVVDEEFGCSGVSHMLEKAEHTYSAAVIGEPTDLKTIIACKGVFRAVIQAKGIEGHSSGVKEFDNAIINMSKFIIYLEERIKQENSRKKSSLTGIKTFNPGKISGGKAANIVPDLCSLDFEIRLLPDETKNDISKWLVCVLTDYQKLHPGLELTLSEPYLVDEGYEISEDERISRVCGNSANKIKGVSGYYGVNFGCDATKFHKKGIPAVVLGPGSINDAHASNEKVVFDDVIKAVDIYLDICMNY